MAWNNIKTFEQYAENGNLDDAFTLDIPLVEWCHMVLREMNIEYDKVVELDNGNNGVVIDLGKTVLKITTDNSEAYYAHKLLNIQSDNLVKVYDIILTDSPYQYGELYVIHMEKLNTNLVSTMKSLVDAFYYRNPIVGRLDNNIPVPNEDIIDYLNGQLVNRSSETIMFLYNKWLNVYNECRKYDLPIDDLRWRNVGGRIGNTSELVFFDISESDQNNCLSMGDVRLIKLP
jgi:hypothetical protein